MQGNHRISLGHSWAYGLSTSGRGLLRGASAVGQHERSKAPLAVLNRSVHERSYVGMTGSLTSHGVISGV